MIYRYKNIDYQDIFSLAKIMNENFEDFSMRLKSEELVSFIKEESKEKYEHINKILSQNYKSEISVFFCSYILNPYMALRYKNYYFKNYQELGKNMLLISPRINADLFDLVNYHLISFHMKSSLFANTDEELYKKVISIENMSNEDANYSYFKIAYLLSKKTSIIYEKEEYEDIYSLVYYLIKNKKYNLNNLGDELAASPLIRAYKDFGHEKRKIETFLHLLSENERYNSLLEEYKKIKN